MRCAVCGVEGARELTNSRSPENGGPESLGHAHDGECVALLWEDYFIRAIGGDAHEHAEVLWRWQRKAAQVAGRPFATPPPKSPAEQEMEFVVAVNGWDDVARELA